MSEEEAKRRPTRAAASPLMRLLTYGDGSFMKMLDFASMVNLALRCTKSMQSHVMGSKAALKLLAHGVTFQDVMESPFMRALLEHLSPTAQKDYVSSIRAGTPACMFQIMADEATPDWYDTTAEGDDQELLVLAVTATSTTTIDRTRVKAIIDFKGAYDTCHSQDCCDACGASTGCRCAEDGVLCDVCGGVKHPVFGCCTIAGLLSEFANEATPGMLSLSSSRLDQCRAYERMRQKLLTCTRAFSRIGQESAHIARSKPF